MANQPNNIPMAWATSNSTVGTIPTTTEEQGKASWAQGFPLETGKPLTQGGIPPKYSDFNAILQVLSEFALFAQEGGQYAYSATIDYSVGALVLGADGYVYRCALANGPSSTVVSPVGDSSGKWEKLISQSEITAMQAQVASATSASLIAQSAATAAQTTAAGAQSAVSSLDAAAVKTSGNQVIGGTKTFSGNAVFSSGATFASGLTASGGVTITTSGGSTVIPSNVASNSSRFLRGDGTWADIGAVASATSAASAGVATKIGTATVGSNGKPVYISAGVPVSMAVVTSATNATSATSATSAATATSAVSAGVASKIGTATVGASGLPVYISAGIPVSMAVVTSAANATNAATATNATSATSATNATNAASAGVATKIGTGTVGTSTKPVYISAGVPVSMAVVASATNATSATSAGIATSATSAASAASAGIATKLGTATVGTSTKPIYLSAGIPVSMAYVTSAVNATNASNATSLGGQAAAAYALNGAVVKLSGNQEISGTKTFAAGYLPLYTSTITKEIPPASSDVFETLSFRGNAASGGVATLGGVQYGHRTNGGTDTKMMAYHPTSASLFAHLMVGWDSGGKAYATAPNTRTDRTNAGDIVTRGFLDSYTMLSVRSFGAVGNGTTDDYAAIQAALNQAHTSGQPLLFPAGTYFISKHLEIGSNTTILGYGATIKRGFNLDASNYGSTVWLVRNSSTDTVCSNVHIFGLTFDNNGSTYNTVSQNIVTIGGKTSNGVTESFTANNISFIDCTFEKWINNHALDVASTKGLKVIRCIFRGVKYDKSLVDASDEYAWKRREAIQSDDSPVVANYNSDWLIDGNLFEGIDSTFVAPRSGLGQHGGVNNINAKYRNFRIVNNTFLGCGYAALTLFGISDSVVSGNYIKDCFFGIELTTRYSNSGTTLYRMPSDNIIIDNNTFIQEAYNKYSGKNVPFDPGNTTDTYTADCIVIKEGHDNVTGTSFANVPFGPDNVMITNNTIVGFYAAVRSFGFTNSRICNNYVNDSYGAFACAGQNIEISDNMLVNAGYGIRFNASSWGYAPNDNNENTCQKVTIKNNVLVTSEANNCKISANDAATGVVFSYKFVNITGNVFYDEYNGTDANIAYITTGANSASVIQDNAVYAKKARSISAIVGSTTGNVVRNNDWFVNGVLHS